MESIVDQNEPEEEEDISSYTWEIMSRTMKKTGFREGAAAGWDLTFQEGFNKGYTEGFDAGFSLGYLKGIVCTVSTHISDLDNQLNTDTRLDQASRGVCQVCSKQSSDNYKTNSTLSEISATQKKATNEVITALKDIYANILDRHNLTMP